MYPLKSILINCGESLLPHVRRELILRESTLEAEFQDVRRALEGIYSTKDEPRLLLLHVRSADDLTQLKRLSGTLIGMPVVALLEAGKNADAILAAMRAGAAQVIPLPLDPADFRTALECLRLPFGRAASTSRVIALSGVNGGCGTTSIAINLAYELAHKHSQRTVLVELSLQMGMLATYLNIEPKFTLHDLLKNIDHLDGHMVQQALTKYAEHLHVLAGPHNAIAQLPASPEGVRRLIDCTRRLGDVVVLDVPATFSDLYFETLTAADHIVLLGEQKIPSIRNLKLVLDTLDAGTARARYLAINRYDPRIKGFTLTDLEKLLAVNQILPISDDRATMNAALAHGRPVRLEDDHSPILTDLGALARTVLGLEDAPVKARNSTIFGQMMHAIGLKG